MAISRLNTLLAIMLAALVWGCGRSSSNDRNSSTETLPPDEAIETILDTDVPYDECMLSDYAHQLSRGEEVDVEQTCYMLKQCQATAHHLQQQLAEMVSNDDPVHVSSTISAITHDMWYLDYVSIKKYLYSASLPEQFADILKDLQATDNANNKLIEQYSRS